MIAFNGDIYVESICPHCQGVGHIMNWDNIKTFCHVCQGTGEIKVRNQRVGSAPAKAQCNKCQHHKPQ